MRSCFKSKVKGDERDGRTDRRTEGQLDSVTNDREIEVEPRGPGRAGGGVDLKGPDAPSADEG